MDPGKIVAVIGASGAIGGAFVEALLARADVARVYAFSRAGTGGAHAKLVHLPIDITQEASIAAAAEAVSGETLDMVLVATGLLHAEGIMPEKALRELEAENLATLFAVNSIGPALVMRYFLPLLPRGRRAVFAALSARVGSISDNRLGGWYGYRAAKAALNMFVSSAAIEMARRWPQSIVVGLHPGTVDSGLSKPFQAQVAEGKLFTPAYSAERMLAVLDVLTPEQSGRCFAYDGTEVQP